VKAHTILIVDGQWNLTKNLVEVLSAEGYRTVSTTSTEEVVGMLKEHSVDLIISHRMREEGVVEEVLSNANNSPAPRIILTDRREVHKGDLAVGREGVCWVINTPWEREELCVTIKNALQYAEVLARNEALLETAKVLAAKDIPFEDKLQRMLTICLRQIDAEKGSIMLRDKQGDLVVRAATNQRLVGIKRYMNDEKRVSVWVVKHGEPLFVENINEDPRFAAAEESLYKNNNFLCVPIKNEDDAVIGVFNVTDKREGGLFSREDEVTLSTFISRIVLLIENAQLKEELEGERARLKKKNEELLAVEKMREDLVNMIIHDLKGPLAEVMANLDLLGYEHLESNAREYLDTAIQGSNNLLRMVFNLLDVRRMEEGKVRLHNEECEVSALIEEVITKHKTMLRHKALEVTTVVDREGSTWIADRSLIERVLSNLLINAIEYSHRGGLIEIVCASHHETGQLRLEVSDRGKGIPKEFHQKIFDKFSQVDRGYAHRRHSTGLGLTFCKMAVEAHQGKIWVESEEGKGSRFIFLLSPMKLDEGA
jgi:two-component system sensor histidine kinase KdpD